MRTSHARNLHYVLQVMYTTASLWKAVLVSQQKLDVTDYFFFYNTLCIIWQRIHT